MSGSAALAESDRLVKLAETIATETVAPLAGTYDRAGEFPSKIYDVLRRSGLTALAVPREFGGLGADWHTYCLVLRTLARACGSTALTLNMHSSVVRMIDRMGTLAQRQHYLSEASKGRLFASLTSEPATSFRGRFSVQTRVDEVEGGYILNGLKFFCSLSSEADYFFVWAMPGGRGDLRNDLLNLVVPAKSEGVRIERTWDAMAMRATASHTVHFENVFVPSSAAVGGPGGAVRHELTDVFILGYAAVYLGLAEAAYRAALDFVMNKKQEPGEVPLKQQTHIQQVIGQMDVAVEGARLFLERAIHLEETGTQGADRREAIRAKNQAKYAACEAARTVADAALRLVGGRALLRGHPLERVFRDAHVGMVMPPNHDQCLETIGKLNLGFTVAGGFLSD